MNTNTMMQRRNLRVTEQLLAELEAGRFESALVKRILEAPSAFPYLLRACFYAEAGRYASARADLEQALRNAEQTGTRSPVVELSAGVIAFVTRDYARALALLEAAASSPKAAPQAYRQMIAIASGLGWDHDVRRTLDAAIAHAPHDPSWHAHAVHLRARGRDWERALTHAERVVELAPEAAGMWMELAGICARLDRGPRALAALHEALERVPADPNEALAYHVEAARVAIDASELELAAAQLQRAVQLDPSCARHHVALAELASWAGDLSEARVQTELALVVDETCAGALRMRGVLQLQRNDHGPARASFEAALAADPSEYQAHLWLAELDTLAGDSGAAHAHLDRAVASCGDYSLAEGLLRFVVTAPEHRGDTLLLPSRVDGFATGLRELCPELAAKALSSRRHDETLAAVEAALAALGMNRSVQATATLDGQLRRLHTRTGCRHACRRALQLLRVSEGPRALAALDALVEAYPGSSLPHCHRGELHLWLNDFEAAKADLEHATQLVRGTRWAYIGLSTLGLLDGDYAGSLAVNARGVQLMGNTEGPAIYVYRGEAKRKLGRLDEAIPELEAALERHGARASAALNLALAYYANGQAEPANALWRRLRDEQSNGLLSDAARELKVEIWLDEDGEDDRPQVPLATRVAVLEHALEMMGGNRSSGLLSYWTADGHLRFCPQWPLRGEGPHARDAAHLGRAKRMLLKALTHYSGPRRSS